MKSLKSVVGILLVLNIAVFLLFSSEQMNSVRFGLHYPGSSAFQPYQFITYMFMHAGIGHIFFNMYALLNFGSVLEEVWGPWRFIVFYLLTGLGAAGLHLGVAHIEATMIFDGLTYPVSVELCGVLESQADVINCLNNEGRSLFESGRNWSSADIGRLNAIYNIPSVGASGAIYGLLLAYAMYFPDVKLILVFFPVPIKAKYFMPLLMAVELFLGVQNFSWDNIAHFAHLGGALVGFILIWLWKPSRPRTPPPPPGPAPGPGLGGGQPPYASGGGQPPYASGGLGRRAAAVRLGRRAAAVRLGRPRAASGAGQPPYASGALGRRAAALRLGRPRAPGSRLTPRAPSGGLGRRARVTWRL